MAGSTRKVTVNLPEALLESARQITGRGITETLVAGLQELERKRKRSSLRALKGKISIDLDLAETRE